MAPDFDDPPTVEHDDRVGTANGGQAVRDHERRAIEQQRGQGFLDQTLGFVVEGGRGFVENQERRVLEQRAGNRQTLALAAGQPLAALADGGLVAVRLRRNEVVRVGRPRRRLDLGQGGARCAVGDVGGDGVVEQHRLLRHHANLRPQRRQAHLANVVAVDQNGAAGDVVEPR